MNVEQQRLVDYLTVYLEESEPVAATPTQPAPPPAPPAFPPNGPGGGLPRSAVANKTIQTRRATLGPKTVTKSALKKLTNANAK